MRKNQEKIILQKGTEVLGWTMRDDVEILSKDELESIIEDVRFKYSDELHEAFRLARTRIGFYGGLIKAEIDITTGDVCITNCKENLSNELDSDKYLLLFEIEMSDEATYNIDDYLNVLKYGCEEEVIDFYKENLCKEYETSEDVFSYTMKHFGLDEDKLIEDYYLAIEEDALDEATKGNELYKRIKELYSKAVIK